MTWLLLDVSYLAHRAAYTTGGLHHNGNVTGALYGLFRSVFALRRRFGTDYVCWCFDDKTDNLFRKKDYEPYKAKRLSYSFQNPELLKSKRELVRQVLDLKKTHLPAAKCKNVGFVGGYEADDVIAWYANGIRQSLKSGEYSSAIIVSADEDLFQLVGTTGRVKVSVYNPTKKELTTETTFLQRYGFSPKLWPRYKALAGCKSDNIPGLFGIGPKTAGAYLRGRLLSPGERKNIRDNKTTFEKFLNLTTLPYHGDGVPNGELVPVPKKDKEEHSDHWAKVFRSLGFHSLAKGE